MLIILFTILSLFQTSLIGTWELTSTEEFNECPDYLTFSNNNRLLILNECYGVNPDIAGTANFELSGSNITLTNLEFTSNYRAFSEEQIEYIQFVIRSDTLVLNIMSNELRTEKYIRMQD